MSLRIGTNLPSLAAQRYIETTTRSTERSMKQLASGNRFVDLSEGAADFAIGETLRAQAHGLAAAKNNAEGAQSFLEVAEGGLNEQNNLMIRMRELAVASASDTYSDDERAMMNQEVQQLGSEVDRIAKTTSYGSQRLLSGSPKSYEFQVGPYHSSDNIVRYNADTDTTTSNLGIDSIDVSDRGSANDAIDSLDNAMKTMGRARASFGAIQSRMNSVVNSTADQVLAIENARSRYQDTDVAKAYADVVKGQAMQQYQIQALGDANRMTSNILKLIA